MFTIQAFYYDGWMKFPFINCVAKPHYFDLFLVCCLTVLSFFFTRHFNLAERFYSWSRLWEEYQADEFIFPLFTICICLIWFSRRRYVEAKTESLNNAALLSENRRLIHDLTSKQEHERLFLAQELHDVFSQYLTALRSHGEFIHTVVKTERNEIKNAVDKILDNVNNLHQVTRSLLKTLRPPLLDFGIVMAIEDLVTEWHQTHRGILCKLDFDGTEPELNEEELLTIYRTVQEGLSNIVKHANANNVNIMLFFLAATDDRSAQINLTIINDGDIGFNEQLKKRGFGLIGIRERASMLNGQFSISNNLPSGSKLELRFPLKNSMDE